MKRLTNTNSTGKSHSNLIPGAKRAYGRERQRSPELAPLLPGRGSRVEVNGAIRIYLRTTRGEVVYTVRPSTEWRFAFEGVSIRPVVRPRVIDAATIERGLSALVDLERAYLAAQQINGIAAK